MGFPHQRILSSTEISKLGIYVISRLIFLFKKYPLFHQSLANWFQLGHSEWMASSAYCANVKEPVFPLALNPAAGIYTKSSIGEP